MNRDDLDGSVLTLTYTSSATHLMSVGQLVELIEQIRPKNARLGVTGLLLYSGGTVMQTLEGDADVVGELLDVIAADPRHTGMQVVDRRYVDERAFSTWSMGFRNVSSREVAELQDFSAFARESVGEDLSAHAVAAFGLLETFRLNAV
ncbi:BLUF domain-containing protein [Nocardioides hwasunensis]|uniref:BLUF domain-containing protein n=1 Tax=Nocardioides hwasunensis TaxID=397258 RepID=A0ABR8MJP3_9ACTN|nr:BLUF domain-containing protein [Nocardioides hwasunensis]MBD3916258.1 BLUF domain-containing protein [Nocardioides hwasunensis]